MVVPETVQIDIRIHISLTWQINSNQMGNRDNFSPNVKRTLAARAGHRCSVCQKSTSGPSNDSASVLSDGIAAHITAASPNGPRFDPSLTSEERHSAENGIWACTQHGREIDADASAFSVELLRGLKRIREESAKRDLESGAASPRDDTASLIEFPHAETTYKMFEIVGAQPYSFTTTSAIREALRRAGQPSRLLDLASEVIPEIWDTHPNAAGILSTLLSTAVDVWQPTHSVLEKLRQLCDTAIQAGDWTQVASAEPLAFALGAKGHPEVHRRLLERLIEDRHWREADAARIRKYYGTIGVEIAAIVRHWHDPLREGLLRANDVARLIDLLLSGDETLAKPFAKHTLLDLLEQHALVLADCGEVELASRINELSVALRHLGKNGETV
jgi:flavin-binding protein dodecin